MATFTHAGDTSAKHVLFFFALCYHDKGLNLSSTSARFCFVMALDPGHDIGISDQRHRLVFVLL